MAGSGPVPDPGPAPGSGSGSGLGSAPGPGSASGSGPGAGPPAAGSLGPVLEVRGLTVGYGGRAVLSEVTFDVYPGQRVAVVGPNGAGKTTLFKCIAGLLRPWAGSVVVHPLEKGARQKGTRRRTVPVAYAPQREAVNWHYPATVYDVVMMARFPHYGLWGRPSSQDHRAVLEALEQVGMARYARAPIQELSGGQQQRVFLARALAQQASLVILDEPFNAVEEGAQEAVVAALSRLRERGVPLLISTHDLDFVAESHWFDRVMVVNGRILAYGPPEEVCSRNRPGGALWALRAGRAGQNGPPPGWVRARAAPEAWAGLTAVPGAEAGAAAGGEAPPGAGAAAGAAAVPGAWSGAGAAPRAAGERE